MGHILLFLSCMVLMTSSRRTPAEQKLCSGYETNMEAVCESCNPDHDFTCDEEFLSNQGEACTFIKDTKLCTGKRNLVSGRINLIEAIQEQLTKRRQRAIGCSGVKYSLDAICDSCDPATQFTCSDAPRGGEACNFVKNTQLCKRDSVDGLSEAELMIDSIQERVKQRRNMESQDQLLLRLAQDVL